MSEQNTNPLLDKIRIPGETFRLPSRGLFYNHNELSDDVVDGEVHVLPMTTVDELAFKSADKLFTGQAVAEVFARRIPQIQQPMKLLSKDVDYLMMCLRLVSYGENMELEIAHDCDDAKEHSYNVPVREVIQATHELDPTSVSKFSFTTPNGQTITLRPPVFEDVLRVYQTESNLEDLDNEEIASMIFDNLSGMIRSVDDVEDRAHIKEWLANIPAGWVKDISSKILTVSEWGVETTRTVNCPDCNSDWDIEVPTNPITYFT
jgi:hypothetical protein